MERFERRTSELSDISVADRLMFGTCGGPCHTCLLRPVALKHLVISLGQPGQKLPTSWYPFLKQELQAVYNRAGNV